MLIKQISVFLENKTGRLAEVTRLLADNEIDIFALSVADTNDYSILRLVVNYPIKAEEILNENGFSISMTSVLAIAMANEPGSLAYILDILGDESIGIEYMYAVVGKPIVDAIVIIRVFDAIRAIEVLKKNNIKVVDEDELKKM